LLIEASPGAASRAIEAASPPTSREARCATTVETTNAAATATNASARMTESRRMARPV